MPAGNLYSREDTNPGFRVRALGPLNVYKRWTGAFGQYRRLFVPVGVVCLVALGVHVAADRFDDWAFWVLDLLDLQSERAYGLFADIFFSGAEEKKLAFAGVVQVSDKENAARWMALGVEIFVDLRLGFGAVGAFPEDPMGYVLPGSKLHHRLWGLVGRRLFNVKRGALHLKNYLKQPTIEKLYLPLAIAMAVLAGSLALFVSVDNALFAVGRRLPAEWMAWQWLSPWPAILAALTVFLRLGVPAVLGSMARCSELSERDRRRGESMGRRVTRGLFGALLILPLIVAGLYSGTPLGRWLEILLAKF